MYTCARDQSKLMREVERKLVVLASLMSLQVLRCSLAVHRLSVSRGQSGVHEGTHSKKCTTTTEINLACCVSFAETSSKSETDVSFRREFHLGRRGKVARDRIDFFSFFSEEKGGGEEEPLVSIIHHRARLFRDIVRLFPEY